MNSNIDVLDGNTIPVRVRLVAHERFDKFKLEWKKPATYCEFIPVSKIYKDQTGVIFTTFTGT